uniref:Uncharacterized protein n=1 Tax=Anopheles atroparvus TaxID=41427 RepID=A0AAG5DCR7_ANOAO
MSIMSRCVNRHVLCGPTTPPWNWLRRERAWSWRLQLPWKIDDPELVYYRHSDCGAWMRTKLALRPVSFM